MYYVETLHENIPPTMSHKEAMKYLLQLYVISYNRSHDLSFLVNPLKFVTLLLNDRISDQPNFASRCICLLLQLL